MIYHISRVSQPPELAADWNSLAWRDVSSLRIDQFHPNSSDHRPITEAKLLYTDEAIHVIFRVQDRFVRCIRTKFQEMVCRDSCVEIFLQPGPECGYFNFEFNCGGAMLIYFIEDATRTADGFKKYRPLPTEHGDLIRVATTMPAVTPVEMEQPVEWRLEASIPFALFEHYVPLLRRTKWRGNLFKCASDNSKPHWASWSNIGEELNFHQPAKFGELIFDGKRQRV